jgi:predicted dehydrogenase
MFDPLFQKMACVIAGFFVPSRWGICEHSLDERTTDMKSDTKRIRLGIAGQANSFHARCITSIINGVTRKSETGWGVFEKVPELASFGVSAVYDPDRDVAETFAGSFGVPNVASSPEELADMVDGVCIVCEKNVTDHHRLAPPFLAKGVPTYVDKPFAATVAEAQGVVNEAIKQDTPVLSCSARRYCPNIVGGAALAKKEMPEVFSGHVLGDWRYETMLWYGVHAIDVLFAVLGPHVVAVHEIGNERDRRMKLTYRNGTVVMVELPYDLGVGTSVVLFGKRSSHHPVLTMGTGRTYVFFTHLIYHIGGMIASGEPPVPYAEMVHVIRVLNAAEESLAEGKEIQVEMGGTNA